MENAVQHLLISPVQVYYISFVTCATFQIYQFQIQNQPFSTLLSEFTVQNTLAKGCNPQQCPSTK